MCLALTIHQPTLSRSPVRWTSSSQVIGVRRVSLRTNTNGGLLLKISRDANQRTDGRTEWWSPLWIFPQRKFDALRRLCGGAEPVAPPLSFHANLTQAVLCSLIGLEALIKAGESNTARKQQHRTKGTNDSLSTWA